MNSINTLTLYIRTLLTSFLIISVSFTYSQYGEVRNKRNEMVSLVEAEKFSEITLSEVYKTPPNGTENSYNLLLMMEFEVLEILKGNFNKAITLILNNEKDYFSKTKKTRYGERSRNRPNRTHLMGHRFEQPPFIFAERSFSDKFNKALLGYLEINAVKIKEQISISNLSEAEKSFLNYYINLSVYYKDHCIGREQERVHESAERLINDHPNSQFASFAQKYTTTHYSTSNWGREWSYIAYGRFTLLDGDARSYSRGLNTYTGIGYGWNYKNIFIKGAISNVSMNLEKEVFNNYQIQSQNSDVNYFKGGFYQLYAGYSFHIGNRFTVSPYVGRKWARLNNRLAPKDQSNDSIDVRFDISDYMAGITIDVNFFSHQLCGETKRKFRHYQRINIGVSRIDAVISSHRFGSPMLFFQYSFGFQLNRNRLVKRL